MKTLLIATLLISTTAGASTIAERAILSDEIEACKLSAETAQIVIDRKDSGVRMRDFINVINSSGSSDKTKAELVSLIKSGYSYTGKSFTLATKTDCYSSILEEK